MKTLVAPALVGLVLFAACSSSPDASSETPTSDATDAPVVTAAAAFVPATCVAELDGEIAEFDFDGTDQVEFDLGSAQVMLTRSGSAAVMTVTNGDTRSEAVVAGLADRVVTTPLGDGSSVTLDCSGLER